ncbi:MAG: hypothetical protein L0Z73_18100 [Gammaproteobacteria bacterium]|nr:hypothetical protein [Gammaproteobacteria bacterium]
MRGKDQQKPLGEQLLLSAAKATLEDSVEQIDAQTLARLAAIRQSAVDAAMRKHSATAWFSRWILPMGGAATAMAVALVVFTLWVQPPGQDAAPVAVLEDLNILTGSEEIEFYQELEFYEWLAVNEQAAG